jgi:hypothetical protein
MKPEGTSVDERFFQWLVNVRGLSEKPAKDILSRCRRIERTFGVELAKVAATQSATDTAVDRIRASLNRNDVLYAFRLFVTFRNPKVKFVLYAKPQGFRRSESRVGQKEK